ncbi:MAG: hypothetical protein V7746_18370 [Halioglobus sp.]
MIKISWARFWLSFFVGWVISSQLNWAAAELLLNPIVTPMLDGFMRTADNTSGAEIVRMTLGYTAPVLVGAFLLAAMDKPAHWAARALFLGLLVSLTSFYGTYTFISGWGAVNWVPLMITATFDMVTLTLGLLTIGLLQNWRR